MPYKQIIAAHTKDNPADLSGANLHNADLHNANLSGADLRYANFVILVLPIWTVCVHVDSVRIGCQLHSHKWLNFTDADITQMNERALEWWKQYKPLVMAAINTMSIKV